MAGASINHLPNEIHKEILQVLFSLSVKPTLVQTDEDKYLNIPPPVEWEESNAKSPSLFPFNAARVCKLWYNTVIRFPKCWNRLVFDVTRDPTPFLNAFSWSTYREKLQVLVFTSAPYCAKLEYRACEARRVAAITDALLRHLNRCESIAFEVKYGSSLPLPARFFERSAGDLKKFRLDCDVSDDDLRCNDDWANPTTSDERYKLDFYFPELDELSMTGFCFMSLARHHPNWLRAVRFGPKLDLSISSFRFPDRGFFSVPTFVYYLTQMHEMRNRLNSLTLSDLDLCYEYDDERRREGAAVHQISWPRIHFYGVCEDFLSYFYSLADVTARECLSFTCCNIPIIRQKQHGRALILEGTGDPSAFTSRSQDTGRGLRNILEVWSGSELEIGSCETFDDDLLDWLKPGFKAIENKPFWAVHSVGISSLSVHDCENFTSRGMREFIDAQNKFSEAEDENGPDTLWEGKALGLSVESTSRSVLRALILSVECRRIT